MNTPDPAQAEVLSSGLGVQPDGPLSGAVKREGAAPSIRYQRHLASLAAQPKARLRGLPATPTVYFIRAVTLGLIKIGVTMDLGDRIKTLRVGCPDQLELVGAIFDADGHRIEERLHARFGADRSHGEWFRPSAALLAFVAQHTVEAYEAARSDELRDAMALTYGAGR